MSELCWLRRFLQLDSEYYPFLQLQGRAGQGNGQVLTSVERENVPAANISEIGAIILPVGSGCDGLLSNSRT